MGSTLAERAAWVSSVAPRLADVSLELGKALTSTPGDALSDGAQHARARIASIVNTLPNASAWIGVMLLESPLLKRQQWLSLIQHTVRRGIHRDLTDLPAPGAASAGVRLAVAVRKRGDLDSVVLRHASRWIADELSSRINAADAAILSWTVNARDLEWVKELCRGDNLQHLVEFALWLQAVEHGEDPGSAPPNALASEWFACRGFRGPRRHLARQRGAAAGRRDCGDLEHWVIPHIEARGPLASEGQCVVMIEWVLAAVRAWPNRAVLLSAADPALQTRSEALRSTVAAHINGTPRAQELLDWLEGSLRALTTAQDVGRTVHGHRPYRTSATEPGYK